MTDDVNRTVRDWIDDAARRQEWTDGAARAVGDAPGLIVENDVLRDESIRFTVQLLVAERCSRAAAAGLLNAMPGERARQHLAVQVVEEARHVELLTNRLLQLGVAAADLDDTIVRYANPDLIDIAGAILKRVRDGDYVVGVVAQNIIFDEMLVTVYEMLAATWAKLDPEFTAVLRGIIEDESRHVGFGEDELQELIVRHPEKKTEISDIYREIAALLVHTFDASLLDNPLAEELRKLRAEDPDAEAAAVWRGVDVIEAGDEALENELVAAISSKIVKTLDRLGIEVVPISETGTGA
jgi:hypothetical protein